MPKGSLVSLGVLFIAVELAGAQPPSPAGPPPAPSLLVIPPSELNAPPPAGLPCAELPAENCPCFPRIWGGTEYLVWWIRNAPVSAPLVTTGSVADPVPGALGQPGTNVLIGECGCGIHFGEMSGTRVTLGGWFDPGGIIGLEASGFLLERGAGHFSAASDGNGNPLIAIPYHTPGGVENSILVTFPSSMFGPPAATGGVLINATTQLWGAEANGLLGLYRDESWAVDLLAGYRHLDLRESFDVVTAQSGMLLPDGFTMQTLDHFATRNEFDGGQIGARVGYRWGSLSLDGKVLVAFGATHEVLTVAGLTNFNGVGGLAGMVPSVSSGGLLANAGNSGQFAHDVFSVVPQLQFKVGYAVTSWLRGFVAYDFLYWSSVLRPGNQISRVFTGSTMSAADVQAAFRFEPGVDVSSPRLQTSGFWAQGVSLGLEVSW